MSTRLTLQDALLIALVLLAPAFTAGRLADALDVHEGTASAEAAVFQAGVPVDEVAPLLEPVALDATEDLEVTVVSPAFPA